MTAVGTVLARGDGSAGVPVIQLERVSKVYPGQPPVRALDQASLTVTAGELTAIVGPSGSGKSTLLHLMGTLDTPTTGTVRVTGLDVARMADRDLAAVRAARIGFVFQQFHLAEHQSVLGNVADGLLYAGVRRGQRRRLALQALDRVGLAHRAAARPTQLSGGERQRVAIARAVVGDRRLLLADEPSGALDSVNAGEVMRLLHEACQRGMAAVVVTHDAQLAAWADRIVLLRDGRMTGHTTRPPGPESLLMPGEIR